MKKGKKTARKSPCLGGKGKGVRVAGKVDRDALERTKREKRPMTARLSIQLHQSMTAST